MYSTNSVSSWQFRIRELFRIESVVIIINSQEFLQNKTKWKLLALSVSSIFIVLQFVLLFSEIPSEITNEIALFNCCRWLDPCEVNGAYRFTALQTGFFREFFFQAQQFFTYVLLKVGDFIRIVFESAEYLIVT